MKLFKKKVKATLSEEEEIEAAIKKLPKFRRKKAKQLYEEYKNGKILVPNMDVDNEYLMKERT